MWLAICFIAACGQPWVDGEGGFSKGEIDDFLTQMWDPMPLFQTKLPESGFASRGAEKMNLKRDGSCVYLVEWNKGIQCSDFKSFVDVENRLITAEYEHSEVNEASSQKSIRHTSKTEKMVLEATLDSDCIVNDGVVGAHLAGFLQLFSTDSLKAAHKVEIVFPSEKKAIELENLGEVPTGTVKALKSGDRSALSGLTDEQKCLLIGMPQQCKVLSRGSRLGDSNVENMGQEETREEKSGDAATPSKTRIELPNLGKIENEL